MNIRAFPKLNRKTILIVGGLAAAIVILANVPAALALIGSQHGGSPAANGGGGHLLRQPAAVTNGLVGWWKLDGNAKDETANHNDGTLNNFTLDGTTNGWTAGKFGKALMFNGSNDYASMGNVLNMGLGNMTTSVWIKTMSSSNQSIVAKSLYGPQAGRYYTIIQAGYLETFMQGNVNRTIDVPSSLVTDGNWHLVTTSYVRSDLMSLYVDGTLKSTLDISADSSINMNTSDTFLIGAYNNVSGTDSPPQGGEYFNGFLDDVRVYNRALAATEIAKLYAGSNPTNCDQTCVGYWKFDESGSATTAADSSGHGNTGTLMNGASNSPTANGTSNGPLWTSGVFGNGLVFDGSNDYISALDNGSLNVGTSDFSVSFWFKNSNSLVGTNFWNIISKKNSYNANNVGWMVWFRRNGSDGANGIELRSNVSGTTNDYISGCVKDISSLIADSNFHFVVISVHRSAQLVNFYIDGLDVGTDGVVAPGRLPSPGTTLSNTDPIGIGATGIGNYQIPSGFVLDDVRIYSRALAPYEIYDQYLAGR